MMNEEQDTQEAADRLAEIQEEIRELASEAIRLVRAHGEEHLAASESYWHAQITMAISDDHDFIGGGSWTLADTEKAMRPQQWCTTCGGPLEGDDLEFSEDCGWCFGREIEAAQARNPHLS